MRSNVITFYNHFFYSYLKFSSFIIILYIVLPYFIRFISSYLVTKTPLAIGFLFSFYLTIVFLMLKINRKISIKFLNFVIFQLFVWIYFLTVLLVNASFVVYPFKYILASSFSYTVIPILTLFPAFITFSGKTNNRKSTKIYITSYIIVFVIVFIIAFGENLLFYFDNYSFFDNLKNKKIIMGYSLHFLDYTLLKTFSIFSSGLEFGFFSIISYVYFKILKNKTSNRKSKMLYSFLQSLSFICIALSSTRIVWISFILYYIFSFLLRKNLSLKKVFFIQIPTAALILAIGYISIFFIRNIDIYFVSSIITRFNSWYGILCFIKHNFKIVNYMFGYGISQTEVWNPFENSEIFAIDNNFMNIFLLGGLFGVFLFMINYYLILSRLIKISKKIEKQHIIFDSVILWAIFPVIMIFNVLVPSILFTFLYSISIYFINISYKIGNNYG